MTNKTMSGEPITLKDLLEGSVCLDIPVYQRTYEWTATEWRRLFADVIAQMDRVDPSGKEVPKHFMGTILTESENSSMKRQTRSLVDGQQRFVTLALLSAAIRHAIDETAGVDPRINGTSWFEHHIASNTRLRLQTQQSDLTTFAAALRGDWRDYVAPRMQNEPAIWQAYTYFRFLLALTADVEPLILAEESKLLDKLPMVSIPNFDPNSVEKQWVAKLEAQETRKPGTGLPPGPRIPWKLKKLKKAVEERLFFYNLMRGTDDEDTSVIFETINASGRGLFPLDLVKNSIFMRIKDPHKRDEIFTKYWDPAEDRLSKTTWPKKRAPYQEVFLYDYLIASGEHRHQGSISQGRGYNHFLRRLDREVKTSTANYESRLIRSLKSELFQAAAVWPVAVGASDTITYEGTSRKVPKEALDRIQSLMAVSAGPPVPMVMIALVRWLRKDPGWSDATLRSALAAVDSYVVRAAVCVAGISNLRSQFMVICGGLQGFGPNLTASDFKAALHGAEPDAAVRSAIITAPLYQKMKSDALLAVLRGLEVQLTTAGGPHAVDVGVYSVEHFFPQDSTRWMSDLTNWGLGAPEIKALHDRLHMLGNLTPITKPHNSKLRNKPFLEKREGIKDEAALLRVHGSILRAHKWTADHIDKRGEVLANAFVKRWPRP